MKRLIVLLAAAMSLCAYPQSWDRFKEDTISRDLPLIPGWCSKDQADRLMDLVYEIKPLISVEIGAFGGSSTYPIAQTLSFLGQGVVYAIDAWDNEAVQKGFEPNHPYLSWWSQIGIDMNYINHYFNGVFPLQTFIIICESQSV